MPSHRSTSLIDSLLEFIPTSRDIRNFCQTLPSVSGILFPCCKVGSLPLCCSGGENNKRDKSLYQQQQQSLLGDENYRHHKSASNNNNNKIGESTIKKIWKETTQRILKNPHQSVAVAFLVCLSLLLFMGEYSNRYYKTQALANNPLSISTLFNNQDDETMTAEHAPVVTLPADFQYLASNMSIPEKPTTPVFWYLPRSGGNTIAEMFGKCRNMVIAGAWTGEFDRLQIIHSHGLRQVTADLTTREGRNKARDMGLKDANPHILFLSPNVFETSESFPIGSIGQAELWCWFRHPVDRQISMYFWMKSLPPNHAQYNHQMQYLSLGQWAQTHYHQPNVMLATLLGVPSNPLGWTEMDLTIAKNVLRDKARIGLLSKKKESVRRFLSSYHERHPYLQSAPGSRECQERLLDYAWKTKGHQKQIIGKKSDAYQLLLQSNALDVKLYEYAVYLFELQGEQWSEAHRSAA